MHGFDELGQSAIVCMGTSPCPPWWFQYTQLISDPAFEANEVEAKKAKRAKRVKKEPFAPFDLFALLASTLISVRIAMSGLQSRSFAGFAQPSNRLSRDRRPLRRKPAWIECSSAPSWARSPARNLPAAPAPFQVSARRRFH